MLELLSYLFRLLNYIAANTPTIANQNSKQGIDAGVGEIVGLGITLFYLDAYTTLIISLFLNAYFSPSLRFVLASIA